MTVVVFDLCNLTEPLHLQTATVYYYSIMGHFKGENIEAVLLVVTNLDCTVCCGKLKE